MSDVRVVQTPTITAGAYTAGDVVGAALTFGLAAANAGSGLITNAVLTDRSTAQAVLELWLFLVSPTLANADNGVFEITDANLETAKPFAVVEFVTYHATTSGRLSIGQFKGLALGASPIPFIAESGSTNIYGALKTLTAPTYASTADLQVALTARRP